MNWRLPVMLGLLFALIAGYKQAHSFWHGTDDNCLAYNTGNSCILFNAGDSNSILVQ